MRLDDILDGRETVGIAGHVRPDGDCAGSTLGVYNYIRTYFPEKTVKVFLEPLPETFLFLPGAGEISSPKDSPDEVLSLFIALDCGELSRLGDAGRFFTAAEHTLCIDHHVTNSDFADENLVLPDASSTCELIGQVIDWDKITKEIAQCLYTGMVTDTGCFQFESTHRSTMEFAGELMEKGIDYPGIVDRVFYAKSLVRGKIHALAWGHAKLYADGKIIGAYVTREDMDAVGASPRHMEGITNDLRTTIGVEAAFFIYPLEDGSYKGSARSSKTFDCAAFASSHNGGGHVRAAGFSLSGKDPAAWIDVICQEAEGLL